MSRQPSGTFTGMRFPSRVQMNRPGNRDLPWMVMKFRSVAAMQRGYDKAVRLSRNREPLIRQPPLDVAP